MSHETEQDALVRFLARHVVTHLAPEFCTADCMATAILASPEMAAHDRQVAAAALREAADLLDSRRSMKGIASRALDPGVAMAVATLRDRADRLEASDD